MNRILLKYFLLILISFAFEWFFNSTTTTVFLNFIENSLFTIALICPLYLFNNLILKKYYFRISYAIFSLSIFFETVYYYLFKTHFSSSAIFVSLDTNLDEAKEFAGFYLDKPIVFYAILIFIITLIVLLNTKKLVIEELLSKKIVIAIFILILAYLKFSKLIVYNLPYLIIKSSIEYKIESKKLGDYKINKLGNFKNVSRLINNDEQEVYIIIIGESTSKSHLGIYNYYRQTTPLLNKIKDELLIYDDVISPHAYSVGSLTKVLTLGNYQNPEKIFQGNIIQLINNVGFETYWLSNQRPIGPYESMITKISLSANNHEFLTTALSKNNKVLDGELLPILHEILNNKIDKKLIFIHLMGTHHDYENRFPENFAKFIDEPKTRFKTKENTVTINNYDNAILYNDFVISEIIKNIDVLDIKSFVLFFSDHGEEMFDDINMAGHNEDVYSKKMFEIPFILWQSKKYKQIKELSFNSNNKYMIDDLFHSIADLLDIKANEVDSTRSIFSNHFKERKRIIKDTIDYDIFFK